MKITLLAPVFVFLAGAGTALAAPPHVPLPPAISVCEGHALSRAAFPGNDPAPCCAGRFSCPQLLSNTGLIKPKHSNRT